MELPDNMSAHRRIVRQQKIRPLYRGRIFVNMIRFILVAGQSFQIYHRIFRSDISDSHLRIYIFSDI